MTSLSGSQFNILALQYDAQVKSNEKVGHVMGQKVFLTPNESQLLGFNCRACGLKFLIYDLRTANCFCPFSPFPFFFCYISFHVFYTPF